MQEEKKGPATATWHQVKVSDDDDTESSFNITGNLQSESLDDPHNFRKPCRKNAYLIIIAVGLMIGVILLGINARSRSKSCAMMTSLKDVIVVPQATNDLSKLCSPINMRSEKGFTACQQACEAASCCAEEDEELNCMSMSADNEVTCLQYTSCLYVWDVDYDYDVYGDGDYYFDDDGDGDGDYGDGDYGDGDYGDGDYDYDEDMGGDNED
eukprot:CAMPEP_0195538436 /NCGR_PEP_ID=MMETSP0794_2-20130614/49528_1 /TAXON_ID=515487 /ORGANISM="Stephanopyxis turris, Strain CCMP 815" /LENGTH=210 /DNA_ID=CAMNT_0040672415 /DNA_START=29 /DNA_END=661 /DNA_ORIENTATION=+